MTISTTASRISYNGNGSTTAFSFPYRFLTNADLTVIKVAADGTETTLTLNTNYTVTGADQDAGGTVTVSVAPLSGQRLVIYREIDITQEVDYITGDAFPAETHERALDRLTMIAQQHQDAIDRSAKLPVSSTADADALVADIVRLADSADEVDAVAGIEASVVTVAGIDSEVATVAGIAANVTTVAGVSGNVTTVAGISSNVTTVAGVAANVTTVAGVSSSVTTVAGISAAVSTVAADGTDIGAVAAISADVQAVADIATDVSAVENIAVNVTTVAGIAANVTTVAGISTAVSTVATNAAAVSTVSTNIASVNSAAANMAAIIAAPTEASNAAASAVAAANSAASAATALDSFDDRYLGSKASDPTLDNDGNALITGALYYNTTTQMMKVYDGANWIAATAAGTTSMLVYKYVATAGQTTFSGAATVGGTMSYTSSNIIVFLNGASLDSTDYTATNGTSVVLGSAAALNDELVVVAFKSFTVADTYTQSAANAAFLSSANGSVTQAKLAANVAGNGPAFSAYASGTTSVPNSTNTKVLFAAEEFDTNNNFASSTFTPTVAGYYQINASAYSANTLGAAELLVYKNGSLYKAGPYIPATTGVGAVVSISATVYCNGSTDYVDIYVYQTSGTSSTISALQAYTYFQGSLVRAA